MASLIRPTRPYPLPPGAEVVVHDGRPHVRLAENGRKALYPVSKDGTKYLKPAKKWYGQYTDAGGVVRRVPLSANKAAAQQLLAELVRKQERAKAGLHSPLDDHARARLADHLADWEAALRADGAGEKHVRQTVRCARRVIDGTGAAVFADLSASRVQQFVAALRTEQPELPPLDPDKAAFTRGEVAAALGVSPSAVPPLVRRHKLAASGNGKARRSTPGRRWRRCGRSGARDGVSRRPTSTWTP